MNIKDLENKIINDDCLNILYQLPDKCIDTIICDLPYGETANEEDVIIPLDELWQYYKRIIKDNGAIVLFAQGLFYVDLVNSNRDWYRYDLVWDKILTSGFLSANKKPLRVHEQIAIFYKIMPIYNPQMRKGEPLHSKGRSYLSKNPKNQNYGTFYQTKDLRKGETEKYPTSIITCQKPHPSIAKHRTEKPIELLEYLIKTYSNEGDLILDNCSGSGSLAVACHNLNRRFICIEKDYDYWKASVERLENAKSQLNLFTNIEQPKEERAEQAKLF